MQTKFGDSIGYTVCNLYSRKFIQSFVDLLICICDQYLLKRNDIEDIKLNLIYLCAPQAKYTCTYLHTSVLSLSIVKVIGNILFYQTSQKIALRNKILIF